MRPADAAILGGLAPPYFHSTAPAIRRRRASQEYCGLITIGDILDFMRLENAASIAAGGPAKGLSVAELFQVLSRKTLADWLKAMGRGGPDSVVSSPDAEMSLFDAVKRMGEFHVRLAGSS